jgi:hypothetical protein
VKTYRGSRDETGKSFSVTVLDGEETMRPLPLRLDLKNHSPLGFWWGQSGSGAAQLALALLADHLGNEVQALKHYAPFMGFLLKLQDAEGNPVAAWSLTSADIDAALDELLRSSSPTWPFVGAFAVEMERDMRQNPLSMSLDVVPAAVIMGAAFDALQALSRIVVDWDENSPHDERGGFLAPDAAMRAQRLTASLAVQALRLATRLGVLKESPKGQRLVSEDKAAQRQLHLFGDLEKVRVLLGANPGESMEDALYRYTAAVQLGCAKRLETPPQDSDPLTWTPEDRRRWHYAQGSAKTLRADVAAKFDTAAVQQPDVFRRFLEDRWAEFQQGVVDGIMTRWWYEVTQDAPTTKEKAALRTILETYEPLGALR